MSENISNLDNNAFGDGKKMFISVHNTNATMPPEIYRPVLTVTTPCCTEAISASTEKRVDTLNAQPKKNATNASPSISKVGKLRSFFSRATPMQKSFGIGKSKRKKFQDL